MVWEEKEIYPAKYDKPHTFNSLLSYQINEKYMTLAKDATSSGDYVLAESYTQHAEHYQRIINEWDADYSQNSNTTSQQNGNTSSSDQNVEKQEMETA